MLTQELKEILQDQVHRIQCKYGHDDKKCETCG